MCRLTTLRSISAAFTFECKQTSIAAEAVLGGLYSIRIPVSAEAMDAADCVRNHEVLSNVERTFRTRNAKCMSRQDKCVQPLPELQVSASGVGRRHQGAQGLLRPCGGSAARRVSPRVGGNARGLLAPHAGTPRGATLPCERCMAHMPSLSCPRSGHRLAYVVGHDPR